MKPLRERIAEAMARNPHLSQADIARACRVKTPSVTDWLNGKTKSLKSETARLAAGLFGCDQNWLATGVGTPNWGNALAASDALTPYKVQPDLATALSVVLDAVERSDAIRRPAVLAALHRVLDEPSALQPTLQLLELLRSAPTLQPLPRVANSR